MSSQRKSKMLVVLLVVLVITNLGMLYYLLQYQKEKKSRSDKQVEWISKELKLDENQLKQYLALRAKRDSLMQPLNNQLMMAKMKMVNLLEKPANSIADSTVQQVAAEITAAQKGIEVAYYEHFRRMQSICKPEQLPKLDTLLVRMVNRTGNASAGSRQK